MDFTVAEIEDVIVTSLRKLNFFDAELFDRVLKEETINHRFAIYIEEEFRRNPKTTDLVFSVDLEFNKMNGDQKKSIEVEGKLKNVRPDIIVHQRTQTMGRNILVVECKKTQFSPWDLQKLNGLLNQGLNYQYGAIVNYCIHKNYFHYKILQGLEVIINRKINK